MCHQCEPLHTACAVHDVDAVRALLGAGAYPDCKCSLVDVAVAGRRRSAVMEHHVSAAQASILQELVAVGLVQTRSDCKGPVDRLLSQLRLQPAATASFIGREGCRCGRQLEHLIAELDEARPAPTRRCRQC